jgi:hypothetical protein
VQPREERHDVGIGGRRQAWEDGPCGRRRARGDALEPQRVNVDVQIERAAEALDGGDGATPAARDPAPERGAPQPAEDGRQPEPLRSRAWRAPPPGPRPTP